MIVIQGFINVISIVSSFFVYSIHLGGFVGGQIVGIIGNAYSGVSYIIGYFYKNLRAVYRCFGDVDKCANNIFHNINGYSHSKYHTYTARINEYANEIEKIATNAVFPFYKLYGLASDFIIAHFIIFRMIALFITLLLCYRIVKYFIGSMLDELILICRRAVQQKFFPMPNNDDDHDDAENWDHLCVVCVVRLKRVVVLPCRHLCMCIGCSNRMDSMHRRCPMCRGRIGSLMEVFI